ncbi:hypothetical protein C8F01DRAFT_1376465 [Mycena amicta]|nr:hypothetical protein C8F01DRAFT_1376465 [Mycena amicta]
MPLLLPATTANDSRLPWLDIRCSRVVRTASQRAQGFDDSTFPLYRHAAAASGSGIHFRPPSSTGVASNPVAYHEQHSSAPEGLSELVCGGRVVHIQTRLERNPEARRKMENSSRSQFSSRRLQEVAAPVRHTDSPSLKKATTSSPRAQHSIIFTFKPSYLYESHVYIRSYTTIPRRNRHIPEPRARTSTLSSSPPPTRPAVVGSASRSNLGTMLASFDSINLLAGHVRGCGERSRRLETNDLFDRGRAFIAGVSRMRSACGRRESNPTSCLAPFWSTLRRIVPDCRIVTQSRS